MVASLTFEVVPPFLNRPRVVDVAVVAVDPFALSSRSGWSRQSEAPFSATVRDLLLVRPVVGFKELLVDPDVRLVRVFLLSLLDFPVLAVPLLVGAAARLVDELVGLS